MDGARTTRPATLHREAEGSTRRTDAWGMMPEGPINVYVRDAAIGGIPDSAWEVARAALKQETLEAGSNG